MSSLYDKVSHFAIMTNLFRPTQTLGTLSILCRIKFPNLGHDPLLYNDLFYMLHSFI